MTTAQWRVLRQDATGQWLAPLDYTRRQDAIDNIAALDRIGACGLMQTYDPFTGEWTPPIKEQQ